MSVESIEGSIRTTKPPRLRLPYRGKKLLERVRRYHHGGLPGVASEIARHFNALQDLVSPTGISSQTLTITMEDGIATKTDTHTGLTKQDFLFNLPGLVLPNGKRIDPFTLFIARLYDGFRLDPGKKPIILCHGAFTNGNSWQVGTEGRNVRHLHKYDSFANYLASQGFDVYILNLPFAKRIYARFIQSVYGVKYRPDPNVGFDEILEYIPSIIDFVLQTHNHHLQRGGAGPEKHQIDWIGHSLGGMLMYAYLPRRDARIHAAATIGSPVSLDSGILKWASKFNRVVERLGKEEQRAQDNPLSPAKQVVRAIVPLSDAIYFTPSRFIDMGGRLFPLTSYVYNRDNASPYTIKPFLLSAAEPVSPRLMDFFLKMAERNEFTSITPGLNRDYNDLMGGIETPLLFIAGAKDFLATVGSIKNAWRYAALRHSPKMRTKLFPLQVLKDYGHVDLLTGLRATIEVARMAADFFNRIK